MHNDPRDDSPRRRCPSDGSDDHERTLMFVVLLGIAAVSAGFLVLRSRRPHDGTRRWGQARRSARVLHVGNPVSPSRMTS